jgi:hypothetical protein
MIRLATIAVILAGLLPAPVLSARLGGISLGPQAPPPLIVDEIPSKPRTIDAESIRIATQLSMDLYGGLPGAVKPLNLSRAPAAPNFLPNYPAPDYVQLYLRSIP